MSLQTVLPARSFEGIIVFRSLFAKKKVPLTGTPSVRRLKTYSAQTGYVYQYYYEGHRPAGAASDNATEFVFNISADRKTWSNVSVLVTHSALHEWETTHARQLNSTEHYAIAKIALFHAFDERTAPPQMKDDIIVRQADVEGIIETLGL